MPYEVNKVPFDSQYVTSSQLNNIYKYLCDLLTNLSLHGKVLCIAISYMENNVLINFVAY